MSFSLFDLVPAIYRLRDGQIAATMQLLTTDEQTKLNNLQTSTTPLNNEEQALLAALTAKSTRGPLQSLLMVIDEQLQYFSADLDQLYNDQFIETCAPWVIPYIGELIGFQPIKGIAPAVDDPRSEVGNTIALRRRKGTVLALEQLARDVTGWGAHANEFFHTLGATQYVKCVRLHNYYAPAVRNWKPRAFANSGFGKMPRTVDVHNPASPGLPRYNLPNIGIFLWSLQAFSVTGGNPVQASTGSGATLTLVPGCYRFTSLGYDMPLFHAAISQGEQIMTAATEINVPDFLTRPELCADMRKGAGSSYYGSGASLSLVLNKQLLNPYQIQVCDLSGDDGSWNNLPAAGTLYAAAIDPKLGRVALVPPPAGQSQSLTVSYNYGFNGAMGGGEYEREDTFQVTNTDAVFQYSLTVANPNYSNLQDALTYVALQAETLGQVALEIQSSETYTLTSGPLVVDVPDGALIEIRAADGARPTIILDGEIQASGGPLSTLIINGLLISAASTMTPGSAGDEALLTLPATRPNTKNNELPTLEILHTTLVPGWTLDTHGKPTQKDAPAIVAHSGGGEISIELSIVGPIRAPELLTVTLDSSILDATYSKFTAYDALAGSGTGGGAPLTLTGCTVVGKVHAQELVLVSNSIIWAHVNGAPTGLNSGLIADRQQAGCVRFSFIPVNAITPKQFQCVEQSLAGPAPIFMSYRYGQPDYLKLIASTPNQIRRGADDEGEMGAFHFLLAPLREQDLEIRLEEFTPVGLNTALVYQT